MDDRTLFLIFVISIGSFWLLLSAMAIYSYYSRNRVYEDEKQFTENMVKDFIEYEQRSK